MWFIVLALLIAFFAMSGPAEAAIVVAPPPPMPVPQRRLEPVAPVIQPPVWEPEPEPEIDPAREALMARIRRFGIAPGQGRRADLGM
jgi:hypothetical protein